MLTDRVEQILTTAHVVAGERIDYWADMICETYVDLEFNPINYDDEQNPFYGEIRVSGLADLQLSRITTSAQLVKRTQRGISKSTSDYFLISIQAKGNGLVVQHGREAFLKPGQFALYDSLKPYELQFNEPFVQNVLRIPRELLIQRLPTAEWLTARTINGNFGIGRIALGILHEITSQDIRLSLSHSERLRDSVLDLMTLACVENKTKMPSDVSSVQMVHLRLVQHFIDTHLAEADLTVDKIAAEHRISVRYLNMLFSTINTTTSKWIWKRRIESARADISDPRLSGQSISEIAYRWGFNDVAHFSRAFRKAFEMTPKDYRASIHGSVKLSTDNNFNLLSDNKLTP